MIQKLNKMKQDEKLSVNQVAEITGYSWDTVRYWLDECGLRYEAPPTKGGRKNRYVRVNELISFMDKFTVANYGERVLDEDVPNLSLVPRSRYNRAGLAR